MTDRRIRCRIDALPGKNRHHRLHFFNRVIRFYGFRCVNCLRVKNYMTVDHIKRKADGGTNDISNLRLLCLACHRLKDNAHKV
jgi:5-methylcytosine-specific restriction protein A